jgi:hypothetical protein
MSLNMNKNGAIQKKLTADPEKTKYPILSYPFRDRPDVRTEGVNAIEGTACQRSRGSRRLPCLKGSHSNSLAGGRPHIASRQHEHSDSFTDLSLMIFP